MPHPWIYSATLTTDGNINLSVEVTDLKNTTGNIEITGEVTQANGAWARISYVTDIANATEGDASDQDQKGLWFMNVEAVPTKDHPFDLSGDFTVWVRVSKVWVTVLGRTAQGSGVDALPTWEHTQDAQL